MGNSASRKQTANPPIRRGKRIPTFSNKTKHWITGIVAVAGLLIGAFGYGSLTSVIIGTVSGLFTGSTLAYGPEILVTAVNTVAAPFGTEVLTTDAQIQQQQRVQDNHAARVLHEANERLRDEQNARLVHLGDAADTLTEFARELRREDRRTAEEQITPAQAAGTGTTHLIIQTPNTFMPGQNSAPASPTENGIGIRQREAFNHVS